MSRIQIAGVISILVNQVAFWNAHSLVFYALLCGIYAIFNGDQKKKSYSAYGALLAITVIDGLVASPALHSVISSNWLMAGLSLTVYALLAASHAPPGLSRERSTYLSLVSFFLIFMTIPEITSPFVTRSNFFLPYILGMNNSVLETLFVLLRFLLFVGFAIYSLFCLASIFSGYQTSSRKRYRWLQFLVMIAPLVIMIASTLFGNVIILTWVFYIQIVKYLSLGAAWHLFLFGYKPNRNDDASKGTLETQGIVEWRYVPRQITGMLALLGVLILFWNTNNIYFPLALGAILTFFCKISVVERYSLYVFTFVYFISEACFPGGSRYAHIISSNYSYILMSSIVSIYVIRKGVVLNLSRQLCLEYMCVFFLSVCIRDISDIFNIPLSSRGIINVNMSATSVFIYKKVRFFAWVIMALLDLLYIREIFRVIRCAIRKEISLNYLLERHLLISAPILAFIASNYFIYGLDKDVENIQVGMCSIPASFAIYRLVSAFMKA